MAVTLLTIDRLQEAINEDELILTANDRLRRHLLQAWGEQQRKNGLKAWRTPRIYPLNHWLEAQWQTLVDRAHPPCTHAWASRSQRQWLWQQIINQANESEGLLQVEPLAQQADTALRHLTLWEITSEELADTPFPGSNLRSFLAWQKPFEARLAQCGLMIPEQGHRLIAEAFESQLLPSLPRLWLLGFDDIPPLHQRILQAASEEQITLANIEVPDNSCIRVATTDPEAELRAAALWSCEQLQSNAQAVIGIIVPDLGQRRDQVERIFAEVFEPTWLLPDQPRYTLPFNISAGTPLGQTPLIQAALQLLGLLRERWPLNELCNLLFNPFWGDAEAEFWLRTQLVTRLRKLGKFDLRGNDLRSHAQVLEDSQPSSAVATPQTLSQRLQQLNEQRRRLPASSSPRYWSEQLQELLQVLGWPGSRRLDSAEYQQMNLWHKLLEAFASLEITGAELSPTQALQQLQQLAQQTPFQAQTPDSPIQILGALEGAGLCFTHCWVVGLHQRQWPPAPAPNPLLPLELQRQKRMPHASAERELQFARSLTRHYRQCAQQVVLSASMADDQGELAPSPLITDLAETPLQALLKGSLSPQQAYAQALQHSQQLEIVDCAQGPALPIDTKVPGGSSLFRLQSSCPFNAFAQLRLGAQQPDPPVLGLSAAERGILLHHVLAELWKVLGDSETLNAYAADKLEALIARISEQALQPVRRRRPHELGPNYCALELERVQAITMRWLTLEMQRPPFRVEAVEQRRQLTFAGLQMTVFIDRIDLLASGERLLIDYKTGANLKIQQWQGERPEEPQLPLYAVTDPAPVAGIAFAQIHPKALDWIGLSEAELMLPGIKPVPDWPEQQQQWQDILTHLAQEYLRGEARVEFHDGKQQHYQAALIPLNRYYEADTIRRYVAAAQADRKAGT